jgi:antitoxin FitA
MASITIRNLDPELKERLRVRAAGASRSMEDEVREILKSALADSTDDNSNLADVFQSLFGPLGGVDLPVVERTSIREPPNFER